MLRTWDYNDDRGNRGVYFDTYDPYRLREEAQQARDLLAERYVSGREFSTVASGQVPFFTAMEMKQNGIKPGVCAIGAVYYVQGHHARQCNLIHALDKKATELFAVRVQNEDEPCACGDPNCTEGTYMEYDNIVDVNDGPNGRARALHVFDAVIADYAEQIRVAEWMAEDYPTIEQMVTTRVKQVFEFTHNTTPLNYGSPPKVTTQPVMQEVEH